MAKTTTAACSICGGDTNQKILFSKLREFSNEKGHPDYSSVFIKEIYMTLQCAGCDTISFVIRRTLAKELSEDVELHDLDYNYPDNQEFNFLSEDDCDMLPALLLKVYYEVEAAFKSDSEILAGLGLRTLVEAICMEQKMNGDNLQKKIVSLKDNGLISTNELPILDKLRLIGNVAAHQIKGIPLDMLSYALDIVNHILRSIYVLPRINKKLKI